MSQDDSEIIKREPGDVWTDKDGKAWRMPANNRPTRTLTKREANRVLHRISRGATITDAAKECGLSSEVVLRELRMVPGLADRLARARTAAAEARVAAADRALAKAEARTIGEGPNERIDPAGVSLAQHVANHHRWVAGKMDRKNWGDETNVNVKGAVAHLIVGGALGERGQSERSVREGVPNRPADEDGPEIVELVENEDGEWVDPADPGDGGG